MIMGIVEILALCCAISYMTFVGYHYDKLWRRYSNLLIYYQKLRDRLRQLEDDDPDLDFDV